MLRLNKVIALAGVAGSLVWGATANAQSLISIGYDVSASAAPALTTTPSSSIVTGGGLSQAWTLTPVVTATQPFSEIKVSADANVGPSGFLDSTSFDITSKAAGYINMYVTLYNITGVGSIVVSTNVSAGVSGPSGTTLTGLTFYDGTGLQYGQALSLGSGSLGSVGTVTLPTLAKNTSGNFSLTEVFQIFVGGAGQVNDTINMTINASPNQLETPLPAALPLFGSVLGGGLLFGRLRNRRKTRTQLAAA